MHRREFMGQFMAGVGALGLGAPLWGCQRADASACTSASPDAGTVAPVVAPDKAVISDLSDPYMALAGFCDGATPIAASEYDDRLTRLRNQLAQSKQAALIVEAGVDMQYLGGPSWGLSERPLLLVIPRDADPLLIGPAFEAGTLEARQGPHRYAVQVWQEHESPYALVESHLHAAKLRANDAVAVGSATRAFVLDGLREAGTRRRFDSRPGALEACRRRKSPAELALLRRANEATQTAIAAASKHAREGMAEHELALHVREAQIAAGLQNPWALVLFGPNAAYPHGTPEGRKLQAGDLILVDTGGFLHGYASDITRTWAFPDPSAIDDERRRAWSIVRDAQAAALAKIRPGVRCAEVDAAAREVIAKAGFDRDYGHFSHRLGHGIGLQVHEAPYLVRDAEHVLEVGNTMSNEPGLYVPGQWGMRLEDIVAVGEQGPELFGTAAASLAEPFGSL